MATGVTAIRPYFRTQLDALGYREWKDGFNTSNIPATLLKNSYHIEAVTGSRFGSYDQRTQDIEQDVTIRLFLKGYRYPADAIDDALSNIDTILTRVLEPSRRLGSSIKNIYFQNYQVLPLSETNDNAAILEITFSCLIIFS
jgi:hypothetical protein